ncbi:MAG: hypothetical protein HC945_04140 [Nitrosarchaeum sp.]|nr:hypothetical protein [Nitrosarchaeum sp.]
MLRNSQAQGPLVTTTPYAQSETFPTAHSSLPYSDRRNAGYARTPDTDGQHDIYAGDVLIGITGGIEDIQAESEHSATLPKGLVALLARIALEKHRSGRHGTRGTMPAELVKAAEDALHSS